jgi:hypothetical protein
MDSIEKRIIEFIKEYPQILEVWKGLSPGYFFKEDPESSPYPLYFLLTESISDLLFNNKFERESGELQIEEIYTTPWLICENIQEKYPFIQERIYKKL